MTTKEYIVKILEELNDGGYIIISLEQFEAFSEIIKNSPTLDEIDDIIKQHGYKDIDDYNWDWCEGHFDDGFNDDDIYKSKEAFSEHLELYLPSIKEFIEPKNR